MKSKLRQKVKIRCSYYVYTLGLSEIYEVVAMRKRIPQNNPNSNKHYGNGPVSKEDLPSKVRRHKKVKALFAEEKKRNTHVELVSCFNAFRDNKFLRNEKLILPELIDYLLDLGADIDDIVIESMSISIKPRPT